MEFFAKTFIIITFWKCLDPNGDPTVSDEPHSVPSIENAFSDVGNTCILVAMDDVSKWVETITLPNNEAKCGGFLEKEHFHKVLDFAGNLK